jgi:steroid 5-alpha reductase family enzyme
MQSFLILLVLALIASSCGFRKYVWFISLGYGAAIALIGIGLLVIFGGSLTVGTALQCVLLVVYGCRLAGYLLYRDMKTAYNRRMKGEVKSDEGVSVVAKIGIWVSASLLYVLQTSPVLFRLADGKGTDVLCVVGLVISATGLVLETTADLQKNRAKKANPKRFVDTGLFRLVRCPNYFGEMVFWTGVFVSGLSVYANAVQWICAILGYLGIIYVMFGGARRLEIRQDKNYGDDPEYRRYKSTTPIMIPLVPLYSVKEHTWLVA